MAFVWMFWVAFWGFFFFIGMVLLKLKVLLCAGKNPQPLNFSVLLVVCVCGYLLIPLLGSFYEILKMLRGWEGGVPLTLDGESMLLWICVFYQFFNRETGLGFLLTDVLQMLSSCMREVEGRSWSIEEFIPCVYLDLFCSDLYKIIQQKDVNGLSIWLWQIRMFSHPFSWIQYIYNLFGKEIMDPEIKAWSSLSSLPSSGVVRSWEDPEKGSMRAFCTAIACFLCYFILQSICLINLWNALENTTSLLGWDIQKPKQVSGGY